MLNWIWLTLMLGSILVGAFTGQIDAVMKASIESAKSAVTLVLGLIGVMTFWLGMMKVAQDAGLLDVLSRAVRPLMKKLFPDVPSNHPAMSAMILNISANILGLGNAATPFGLKAMMELNKLNKTPGTASNAMALFLAINTSGVALLPLGVIAIRAAAGSAHPGNIFITTLIATVFNTIIAVLAAKFLQRLPAYKLPEQALSAPAPMAAALEEPAPPLRENLTKIPKILRNGVLIIFVTGMVMGLLIHILKAEGSLGTVLRGVFEDWLLVILIGSILIFGFVKEVKVYESLVSGSKRGFQVAIKIIPYLVAMLVAISMFRASGALGFLIQALSPLTGLIGMPAETLPMAVLRPLSGSGAFGLMTETITNYGPDSLIGEIVSTMQGTSETTFYVLAVYCGAVAVKNLRHALLACLIADAAGVLAAVYVCRLFFT